MNLKGPQHHKDMNKPRLPLTWWGIAIRTIVAIAILFGANIVCGLPLQWIMPPFEHSPWIQFAAIMGYMLAITLVVLGLVGAWVHWIDRRKLFDTGFAFSRRTITGLAIGSVISIFVVVAAVVLGNAIAPSAERGIIDANDTGDLGIVAFVAIIFGRAFFLQGIPEELLFRGWLLRLREDKPLHMLAWTTIAFTVIHLVSQGGQESFAQHLLYLCIPFGFGLAAGVLALLSNNFWMAPGIHGGFHLGNAVAAVVVGKDLAPIDWVCIGGMYVLVAVPLLMIYFRRRQAAVISSPDPQRV